MTHLRRSRHSNYGIVVCDASTDDSIPGGKQSNDGAKAGAHSRRAWIIPEAISDVGCTDTDDTRDTSR